MAQVRDVPDDDTWISERRQAIGSRVRDMRTQLNLTQDQVVLAAGIDRVTLWRVESGEEVKLSTLLRIAWTLEVALAELVA